MTPTQRQSPVKYFVKIMGLLSSTPEERGTGSGCISYGGPVMTGVSVEGSNHWGVGKPWIGKGLAVPF